MDREQAYIYLQRWVGEGDWKTAWDTAVKRLKDHKQDPRLIWKMVAYSVCADTFKLRSPVGFFLASTGFDNFNTEDWLGRFKKIVETDNKIKTLRARCIKMGMIPESNLAYYPHARNAITQTYERNGNPSPEFKKKIKQLVRAWGGVSFSSAFRQDRFAEKVLDWESPYHIERGMYLTHGWNRLLVLKAADLEEIPKNLLVTAS